MKTKISVLLIIAFCFLELWLFSMGRNLFGVMWSPLIVFLSGLFAGIGFLLFFYQKEIEIQKIEWSWKRRILLFIVSFFGIWKCGDILRTLIRDIPIDFHNPVGSDIIPQIGIMVERFLTGVFPYQTITHWPNGLQLFPTYLPFTWMPFIITDVLELDYRWMAFAILILSFFYFYYKMTPRVSSFSVIIFTTLLPFIFLYILQKNGDQGTFGYSVETLIGGYYLILATALFSKKNWVRGVALSLCLLSRYSVVLWVPLFFFVLLFKEKKSNIFQIGGWIIGSFLVFYIIPFLSKDPTIFFQGFDYHTEAAKISFMTLPWQKVGEIPAIIGSGFGFAIYFYEFLEGTIEEKLLVYRMTHLILSSLIIALSTIVFYFIKNKIDYRIFLLGTLKIYLVFFYNFIQIPFLYLVFPLVFISLPMIALVLSQKK